MTVFFDMPPIPRDAFDNDEDYQRAVRTSQESRDWSAQGTVFYCDREQIPEILVRLVNAARAAGMGVIHDADTTLEAMQAFCDRQVLNASMIDSDYINGRPIKTEFRLQPASGKWKFDTALYNRDQGGTGTAERLLVDLGLTVQVED